MVGCAQSGPPGNGGITSETFDYNSYFSVTTVHDTGTGVQNVATGTPFVAPSTNNFALAFDTSAWTALSSPYNVDIVGTTRTSSRGAFQFLESSITFLPATYTFDFTVSGSGSSADSPVTFTLTNNSGSTITPGTVSLSNSTDFAVTTNNCTTAVANGGTCTVLVKFAPAVGDVNLLTSTLSITYTGATGSPITASLQGTAGNVAISPTSYAFATTVETHTSADSPKNFTITNTSGSTISSIAVSLTGTNAADFTDSLNTCTGTLISGANCNVQASFVPTHLGNLTATLNVTFTGVFGSPLSVSLSGLSVVSTVQPALVPKMFSFNVSPNNLQ